MVPPGRWFTHSFLLALKLLTAYVHRSTLPQSRIRSTAPSEREPGRGAYHSTCRPETARLRAIFIAPTELKNRFPLPFIGVHSHSLAFARQLPQGGSRGGVRAIQRAAREPEGCGRFSSPLRNSKTVSFYHSSDDTPSVSHSLDSSLREGAGATSPQCQSPARWMLCQRAGTFYRSSGYLRNRGVTGDFHRPYETQKFLHFTIQPPRFPPGKRYRVGLGTGVSVESAKRN